MRQICCARARKAAALSQAAAQIASTQAKGKGMGDVEHYTISVTTSDGKTHDLTLNASGGSGEMEGVAPATAKSDPGSSRKRKKS